MRWRLVREETRGDDNPCTRARAIHRARLLRERRLGIHRLPISRAGGVARDPGRGDPSRHRHIRKTRLRARFQMAYRHRRHRARVDRAERERHRLDRHGAGRRCHRIGRDLLANARAEVRKAAIERRRKHRPISGWQAPRVSSFRISSRSRFGTIRPAQNWVANPQYPRSPIAFYTRVRAPSPVGAPEGATEMPTPRNASIDAFGRPTSR